MRRLLLIALVFLAGCASGELHVKLDADVRSVVADLAEMARPAGWEGAAGNEPGGIGDFLADGSVPMTGALDMAGFDVQMDTDLFLSDGAAGVLQVGTTSGGTDGSVTCDSLTCDSVTNLTELRYAGTGGLLFKQANGTTRGEIDTSGFRANQFFFPSAGSGTLYLGEPGIDGILYVGKTSASSTGGVRAQEHVFGHTTTLGAETAVEVFSVTMADGDFASLTITASIRASDAADDASVETVTVQISLIDMGGGIVSASTPGVVSTILDVGSCVLTKGVWSVDTTDDQSIEIKVASAVAGITQTTHEIEWTVERTANVEITAP